MSTSEIDKLIDQAREHGRPPNAARGRLRRIVARLEPIQVGRLDALREHFPDTCRASLIRAFIDHGLRIAEEHVRATKQKDAP